jgi:hypothetical protein
MSKTKRKKGKTKMTPINTIQEIQRIAQTATGPFSIIWRGSKNYIIVPAQTGTIQVVDPEDVDPDTNQLTYSSVPLGLFERVLLQEVA